MIYFYNTEAVVNNRTDTCISRETIAHNDTVVHVTRDSVSVMGGDYDIGERRYNDDDSE